MQFGKIFKKTIISLLFSSILSSSLFAGDFSLLSPSKLIKQIADQPTDRLFNIIKIAGFAGIVLAAIKFAMPEGIPLKAEAIPKHVEDWCRKVLSDHNININGLTFAKTNNQNCAMEASVKRIYIAPKTLEFLKGSLQNNLSPSDTKYFKNYYTFSLLHEAGHVLDRHRQKGIVFCSLFYPIILNYCLDSFKGKLQENKTLENSSASKSLFASFGLLFLVIKLVRYGERFADEFARKHCTINDIDILNNEINSSKWRFASLEDKVYSTKIISSMIFWLYRKTNKNDVSFEEWLKDNPRISKILFCILIDFTHEYPIDSIKKSEQRKEELLREQEVLANRGSHENS